MSRIHKGLRWARAWPPHLTKARKAALTRSARRMARDIVKAGDASIASRFFENKEEVDISHAREAMNKEFERLSQGTKNQFKFVPPLIEMGTLRRIPLAQQGIHVISGATPKEIEENLRRQLRFFEGIIRPNQGIVVGIHSDPSTGNWISIAIGRTPRGRVEKIIETETPYIHS